MDKAALAQEKIWFDKPSYDKAERLYFERMAMLGTCFKVASRNIMESCSLKSEISVTDTCQNIISDNSLSKIKTEQSKDNKLFILENGTIHTIKISKRQAKAPKTNKLKDDTNVQKNENCEEREKEKEKHDGAKNDTKEEEVSPSSDTINKYNAKEAKEKKNKADTRHRNRERGKNDTKEVKVHFVPVIRNKEQLPTQVHVPNPLTKCSVLCINKDYVPPHLRNKEQLPNQGKQQTTSPILPAGGSLANEVAKARQHIKQSLQCVDDIAAVVGISTPNADCKKDNLDVYNELRNIVHTLEERVKNLEDKVNSMTCPMIAVCPAKPTAAPKQQSEKDEDDEDVDLFGSDSEGEDAEAAKIREERLAAYAAKKSKKPVLIAKSSIILDVKPWDDETDMKVMEAEVRKIETDGLLWGAAKLVPLAFGIHKLQISCVVEDDKVSVDWLTEKIQEIEDFVQSVDIAAFNKV